MSDSTPNTCCVYIIQDAHGAVKIGIAADVDMRLRDLQVGNSHELKMLYKLEVPTRKKAQEIESLLHQRYADNVLRGEWFSIDVDRVIRDIEFAIAVGTVINRYVQDRALKYIPKPPSVVQLSAAQLDEIAKWAIRRGAISRSALMDNFQCDSRTARAILFTFDKFGCLLPVDGVYGEWRYDPQWKSRQEIQI